MCEKGGRAEHVVYPHHHPTRACGLRAVQPVRSLADNVPNRVASGNRSDPSGSSIRLRARVGQYGENISKDRTRRQRGTDLRELTGRRHASLCSHAWPGCRFLTYLHGIAEPSASRSHLSCPRSDHVERGKAVTPPCAMHGKPTVRQADGGTALRSRKKQMPSCNEADRAWNIAQRENLKHSCFGRSAC